MSKEVDRKRVFQTTKVRNSLKNDACWIQNSKQEMGDQDKTRTDCAVETRPSPVRQNSYVLFTARKFELQANAEGPIQNGVAKPEEPVANTTAEIMDEDAANYQSNVEHNGVAAEVSAEVHVAECIQNGEAQPVSSTEENQSVSPVEAAEQPVANTTATADKTVDQSSVEHNEARISADAPVAETSAVAAEVSAVPAVELKPQEEPSTGTEPEHACIWRMHLEDAEVNSTVQPAEGSCEEYPLEQATEEIVEAVAEAEAKALSDVTDAVNATPGEDAALQDRFGGVASVAVESSPETPAVNGAAEEEAALQDSVDAVAEVAVESLPETPAVNGVAEEEAALQDSVDAVAEVAVESSPETPAVNGAAEESAALQVTVEPVPDIEADTVSELPTQAAAETAVQSVECKVVSAVSAEPVESEAQPVDNTVVEQSVEPTPETVTDAAAELNVEGAVEPVTASDVQDNFSYIPIDLSEALDVQLPTTEAAPEPVEDPKQSDPEPNQHSDDTNTSDVLQKSKEELPSTQTQDETGNSHVCSFCDKIIDGNVKIYISEPAITSHAECLKCGACAKALGDLLTPMFLNNQVIKCGDCFEKALMI